MDKIKTKGTIIISGYHGKYDVTSDGRVFSYNYGQRKELLLSEHKGYRRVALSNENKRKIYPVHVLVAKAFIPNPENKPFVNHKDGNKRNNDVSNLEWCTRAENQKHSREVLGNTGIGAKNSHHGYRSAKLYPNEEIRSRLVELGVPRYRHNLAELGEMLPYQYMSAKVEGGNEGFCCWNEWEQLAKQREYAKYADTEADARGAMLIYLLENKLITP